MSDLVALDVQTPTVNGAQSFQQGAAAASDLNASHLQQAQASIGLIGQVALGAMGGDINGKADPAKWAQGIALLKAHGLPVDGMSADAAPVLARASVSTLGQIQNAQSQQQMQLQLQEFANTIQQQRAANTRADAALANDTKRVNYETDPTRFQGSSIDAQAWNVINDPKADPSSPQYAAAYSILAQPKTQLVQGPEGYVPVQVAPTLPAGVRPPTGAEPAGQQPAAPATATPSGTAAAPAQPGGVTMGAPLKGTGKPTQEFNSNQALAAGYADRMAEADAIIGSQAITDTMKNPVEHRGDIPGIGNFIASPQYQSARQAQRDFVNAILRRESGAVISPSEFDNAEKQYFPQPGDSDAVIKQKATNRRTAINGMVRGAGPNYTPPATLGGNSDQPAAPKTQAEYDALPSGATFVDPDDGKPYRKP